MSLPSKQLGAQVSNVETDLPFKQEEDPLKYKSHVGQAWARLIQTPPGYLPDTHTPAALSKLEKWGHMYMRPAGSDKAKRAPANTRSGGLEALVPDGVGYGFILVSDAHAGLLSGTHTLLV